VSGILAASALTGLLGCGGESGGDRSGAGGSARAGASPEITNAMCPVYPDESVADPLTEDLIVLWRGERIGMCCDECVLEWERLWTDAQRDEALSRMRSARVGAVGDGSR
jgi:hypothetical protein